jgi:hypothetical protein
MGRCVREKTERRDPRLIEKEPAERRSDRELGLDKAGVAGGLDPDVEISFCQRYADGSDGHELAGDQIATERLSDLSGSCAR